MVESFRIFSELTQGLTSTDSHRSHRMGQHSLQGREQRWSINEEFFLRTIFSKLTKPSATYVLFPSWMNVRSKDNRSERDERWKDYLSGAKAWREWSVVLISSVSIDRSDDCAKDPSDIRIRKTSVWFYLAIAKMHWPVSPSLVSSLLLNLLPTSMTIDWRRCYSIPSRWRRTHLDLEILYN